MKIQEFCKAAKENGYNKHLCDGWDWIRANLHELDSIFQTEAYKQCDGMKYKCMPLIVGNENLSDDETDILRTAWYLNNEREHSRRRIEYRDKMLADGWLILTPEIAKANEKLELSGTQTSDWLTVGVHGIFKVKILNKGNIFLVAPGKRSKGYFLHTLTEGGQKDVFCKVA
ncbi:MAG: hypothetical protein IMZ53_14965 [Thermoplasmata archaeon]|nr:hypothetical protein [Thermoplasmata archaeon]